MEEKEFVALIDELEGDARQNPGAYKLRVALLAALGQKVVQYSPQEPGYVLGVTSKRRWSIASKNARKAQLVEQLAEHMNFPGFAVVIALEDDYKPLGKVFEQIQGSVIYRAA